MDDRAISIAVGHAVTLGISAILITGLLLGSATLLDIQEKRAAGEQLSDIGSETVSYIYSFDDLNGTGTNVNATVEPNYPTRIVDSYSYRISLEETADGAVLTLDVSNLGTGRVYRIDTDAEIRDSAVSSPNVEINLCGSTGEISLGGCEQ